MGLAPRSLGLNQFRALLTPPVRRLVLRGCFLAPLRINTMRTILAVLALLLAATSALAQSVSGTVTVKDGDSLLVGGVEVRVWGIDAPEGNQACGLPDKPWHCGSAATEVMRQLAEGKHANCERKDVDRYQRVVARCYVDGVDLSSAMVEGGHALAFRRYSLDYVPHEDRARLAGRGMWAGPFMAPWDWRAMKRARPTMAPTGVGWPQRRTEAPFDRRLGHSVGSAMLVGAWRLTI
jgi:endonuclease YncB( thermonuclease family)